LKYVVRSSATFELINFAVVDVAKIVDVPVVDGAIYLVVALSGVVDISIFVDELLIESSVILYSS
jgi:hypothetical protein